jgi:hypothetical protein
VRRIQDCAAAARSWDRRPALHRGSAEAARKSGVDDAGRGGDDDPAASTVADSGADDVAPVTKTRMSLNSRFRSERVFYRLPIGHRQG